MFKKLWKKVKKTVGKQSRSTGKEENPGRRPPQQPDVVNVEKPPRSPGESCNVGAGGAVLRHPVQQALPSQALDPRLGSQKNPTDSTASTAANTATMPASTTEAAKPAKWAGACPSYAAKSVVGQRMTMEDSWQAVPDLLVIPKWWTCNARDQLPPPAVQPSNEPVPAQQQGQGEGLVPSVPAPAVSDQAEAASTGRNEDAAVVPAETTPPASRPALDPVQQAALHGTEPVNVHFFAVYDGHGGPEVAKHCAKSLHEHLKTVVTASVQPDGTPTSAPLLPAPTATAPAPAPASTSDPGVAKGANSDPVGGAAPGTAAEPPTPEPWPVLVDGIEAALKAAFLHTDAQLAQNRSAHEVGTTAVVSLVTARTLWIGNCGDSRALLCREREAIALSLDHKATRVDEVTRVEQAGGYVWWDRVMGELAVSRAIGDHCLRPFVIAEPEITSVLRRLEDQLLIMASDGLWDVFTNEEARTLALEKFHGELSRTSSSKMAVKKAASSLAKAALAKGSRDNVTVVVVDVRLHGSVTAHGAGRGTATPRPAMPQGEGGGAAAAAAGATAPPSREPSVRAGTQHKRQQLAPASPETPGGSDADD